MKNSNLHFVKHVCCYMFLNLGLQGTLIGQNITITGPLVVGPSQTATYDANFTYTVNPLSVITWSCTGGVILSQQVNPNLPINCTVKWGNATGLGTLCIYESPPIGPSQSACITVKIVCGEADGGPDVTLCSGGCSIIGVPAQPGYTYSWTPTTGLSDPNIAQPIACPLTTTIYTVNMQSTNGCPVTQTSLTVTVNSTPAISPSGPINICTPWEYAPTNSSLLTSSTTSSGQYQWYKDGQSISGATSQTHYAQHYQQGINVRTFLYTIEDPVHGCISSPVTVNFVPTPLPPIEYVDAYKDLWQTIRTTENLSPSTYIWNIPGATVYDANINDPMVDVFFPLNSPNSMTGYVTINGGASCANSTYTYVFLLRANRTGRNSNNNIEQSNLSDKNISEKTIIFPNPANSQTTIMSQESIVQVEILDINNTVTYLKKKTGGSISITFDISNLKPGIYLCKVVTKTKTEFLKMQVVR